MVATQSFKVRNESLHIMIHGTAIPPDFSGLQERPAALDPVVKRRVQRHVQGQPVQQLLDSVSNEVPVALVFNGISHAVMMATPRNLQEFALGFSLSEGILSTPDECYGVDVVPIEADVATGGLTAACEVRLEISSRRFSELKERRRSLSGRTGCGVCGVESLVSFELDTPQVTRPHWLEQLSVNVVERAFEQLPQAQVLNQQTGSVHAAGWALPDGQLIKVMEDVGRHNALDKLLGWRAGPGGGEAVDGFVIMSSRASYELIRKNAFLGVCALATISAPTVLAIELAKQANMQLYGLCRNQRVNAYVL